MKKLKVLYVEDEPDIRLIATLAMEPIGGFTVKTCSSAAEALAVIREFMPDVLILDVMMPEMDGIQAFTKLRSIETVAKIPVIFMTAKAQPSEVDNLLSLGAAGVITKPFDAMTLAEQVHAIWIKNNAAG